MQNADAEVGQFMWLETDGEYEICQRIPPEIEYAYMRNDEGNQVGFPLGVVMTEYAANEICELLNEAIGMMSRIVFTDRD
jgi:hypothetical protein